jgi:phycocyanobilin:ferredoxin oxidoreductase
MSEVWDTLISCQEQIISRLDSSCVEYHDMEMDKFNQPDNGWINRLWINHSIRRAHVDVVDARASRGLWMMHVCVFPVLTSDAPIYGFDVIAGKNKMTGAFLDFSATVDPIHPMMKQYENMVRSFIPEKQRTLPEWATNIFSKNMIAAGNVTSLQETRDIVQLALDTLDYYIADIGKYAVSDREGNAQKELAVSKQNWYCENQQKNPHTSRVMKSLGLEEADVDLFCTDILFPKIKVDITE